jgi:peptidoglycan/xylan/chitin deacetylase (PgdA/CDA1 family)
MRRLFILSFTLSGLAAFFRWFFRRECVVLAYHGAFPGEAIKGVDIEGKFVDEKDFIRQLDFLKRHYTPVTLDLFEASLRGEATLPARAVLITIDDGYENNLLHMAPHLQARNIPAAVYVVTGLAGTSTTIWPNLVELAASRNGHRLTDIKARLKSLPPHERDAELKELLGGSTGDIPPAHPFRILSWNQVKTIESMGVQAGSHTLSHAILAREDEAGSRRELIESKRVAEGELGHPVTSFAYPNGGPGFFLPRDEALAREAGYRSAFSMIRGRHRPGDPPYAVRRIPVSREEGWIPLFASRLAFPYRLKDLFGQKR